MAQGSISTSLGVRATTPLENGRLKATLSRLSAFGQCRPKGGGLVSDLSVAQRWMDGRRDG